MKARVAPAFILGVALLIAALSVAAAVVLSLRQPWLGVALQADATAGLRIVDVAAEGPNAALSVGGRIIALGTGAGARVPLHPDDLIEEPDTFDSFAQLEAFFQRQQDLHLMLSGPDLFADIALAEDRVLRVGLSQAPWRAATDLPLVFWVQLLVGTVGLLVGAWVWSLKRRELQAFFFALAGGGLMLSATAAAIYSARELALPGPLFTLLSNANNAGALIFGAGMIGLFLRYPRPLVAARWAFVPAGVLALWIALDVMRVLPGPPVSRQLPITLAMVAIMACVGVQFRKTRGDPRARAVLRWLGLSVLIGAGLFVLTTIVPELFGAASKPSQGYSFLYFLIIYVGVALGVARYRLFELEDWAFRILFYMGGVVLIMLFDTALVLIVSLQGLPALSLSFVVVALFYLPLRDTLGRVFLPGADWRREALFARIVDIALTPPGQSQRVRWQNLLSHVYSPLSIEPTPRSDGPALDQEGVGMIVPAVGAMPALRLDYARQGRKLFSPRDLELARELVTMLRYACASRRAFESGVAEERRRIARDMHDNIGAQLLAALHSRDPARKDGLLRESLTDLRNIINNLTQEGQPLDAVLADLRAETAERLHNAGIGLDWRVADPMQADLSPSVVHALRSVLREAVSNVIRHAGATKVTVEIIGTTEGLRLSFADDGAGIALAATGGGSGLGNMQARIAAQGGSLTIETPAQGTRIWIDLPLLARQGAA